MAILTGTNFGFSPRDDHHLGEVNIKVDASILGNTIRVTATLRVRGDVDDDYEGTIHFAVSQNYDYFVALRAAVNPVIRR